PGDAGDAAGARADGADTGQHHGAERPDGAGAADARREGAGDSAGPAADDGPGPAGDGHLGRGAQTDQTAAANDAAGPARQADAEPLISKRPNHRVTESTEKKRGKKSHCLLSSIFSLCPL